MTESKRLAIHPKAVSQEKKRALMPLVLTVSLCLAPFLPWWEWEWTTVLTVYWLLCAGTTLGITYRTYYRLRNIDAYAVQLESDGIRSCDPKQNAFYLPWSGVTKIRDHPYWQYIELQGPPGSPSLHIDYQLEGLEQILKRLIEKAPKSSVAETLPLSFRKRDFLAVAAFVQGIFVGPVIMLIWTAGDLSTLRVLSAFSVAFVLMALVNFYLPVRPYAQVGRLTVHKTGFHIRAFLMPKDIDFYEVEAIRLIPVRGDKGTVVHLDVVATLVTGEQQSLLPDGQDTFRVHHVARTQWERHLSSEITTPADLSLD